MSAPARLRVADRCDRCRAQAYVEVAVPVVLHEVGPTIRHGDLPGGWEDADLSGGLEERRTTLPLLLCAHHFRDHEPALAAAGATVTHDDRHTLTPRSTQGDDY